MRQTLLHLAIITIAIGLVFSNTLQNEFHLDDHYLIKGNPGIHQVQPIWRHFIDPTTISKLDRITQYRPLLPLTMSLTYAISGDNLAGYHIGNILFHIFAAFFIYFLIAELLLHWSKKYKENQARLIALSVAIMFGIHPVSGFPINYICARDVILMQFFLTATLLSYMRVRRLGSSPGRWLLTLFLYSGALFSKTNAATLPIIIFLFESLLARKKIFDRYTLLFPLPFIVLIASQMLFKRYYLEFSDFTNAFVYGQSFWVYPFTQAKVHFFEYFLNFFWPFPIRVIPEVIKEYSFFSTRVVIGALFIITALTIAWKARPRAPLLTFSILTYFALLIITSSIIPLHYAAAHYRPYPSSPFFFFVLILLLYKYIPTRLFSPVIASCILYFGVSSYLLNRVWRTEESLWAHSVHYGADPLGHMNYAMSIPNREDPKVRYHLEESLRKGPNSVLAHINLGLLYMDEGEKQKGLALINRGLSMRPDWAQAHYWMSVGYEKNGEEEKALNSSIIAAQMEKRDPKYPYRTAKLLQSSKQYRRSLNYLARIEEINPFLYDTLFLKGFALQMLQQHKQAIEVYQVFLRERKDHVQARFNLAYALMEQKQHKKALREFWEVVTRQPEYSAAYLHLASCYEALGNTSKAEEMRMVYSDLLAHLQKQNSQG